MEKQKNGNIELLVLISIIFFLLSSSAALAQESKIVLSPNRFVVLDDPSGWVSSVGDKWSGESTTIRWYVLVINSSGLAVPAGVSVTTYIKYPNGSVFYSASALTDSNGYANFSRNLNNLNQITTPGNIEGYWTINATATVDSQSTADGDKFIYNEYGCGKSGSGCHTSNWQSSGKVGPKDVQSGFGTGTRDSPYLMGWDSIHNQSGGSYKGSGYPHNSSGSVIIGYSECLTCHKSYDGNYTSASARNNYQPQYGGGLHYGKAGATCVDCHAGFRPSGVYSNMPIKTCYGCHPKDNNNLTIQIYTQSSSQGYSYLPLNSTSGNIRAHDSGDTVACITCHDSGHNISKPYNVSNTSNTYTEYQQCTACHQSYSQHNNSLSCTVCHSQDAHAIKVLAQNATYVTGITNPAKGNCTNCHQNSTFQNSLEAQPKAGDYTGRDPPQISVPLNHSTDPLSGALWNGMQSAYWINTSQLSACDYCHDNSVLHNATALGNVSKVKGTNNLNQSLVGSTWCANCHYGNAPGYAGNQLAPQPPEVLNKSGLVPANAKDGTPFYNHSDALSTSYDDATCKACHNNNLAAGATSLNFSHNVATGSAGGRDCVSCHDKGKSVEKVDVSKMNQSDSIHNFLNSNSAIVTPGLNPDNKRCWACHTNSSLGANNVVNEADLPASGHPNSYNVPKKCTQCHIQGNFSALIVSEHFSGSTEIRTKSYTNTNDSCVSCHNKSEMLLPNSDPNGPKSIYAGVSHYGSNKTNAALYVSGGSANCTYCHQNPANAFTTEMIDAAGNSSISNHTQLGTNPACINCHNSGRIHFANLTKPTVSSSLCINCHTNKDQHNGSVECSQCHTQSNRSIHPIQYLQPDGTFKINSPANKSTAVNCTNCHQGAGVSGFGGAPKVPLPVNHSTDPYSGKKWGIYWDNTSQLTACYYCHQIEIHENNTDLLGNVSIIEGSNTLNNPDLANSTWCANCHYAGAQDYKGNLLAVSPPEITDSSLVASDGTLFFNHSGLSNFNDSNCKGCHGFAISGYSETSLNLSHSVSEGGGENCIECHGTNYIGATPSVTSTFVNISAFDESIHQNINATPPATLNNIDCWSCHYNKDMNRLNVKKCGDCHRKPSQWHGNAAITTNLSELW